jgi:hypothetical protein
MTLDRAKDWGMCILFWMCLALAADRFVAVQTCASTQSLVTRIMGVFK